MIPGEFIIKEGTIEYNKGKEAIKLEVVNTGDRPIHKKEINLIDIGGVRRVYGLRNLVDGYLDGRRVKE